VETEMGIVYGVRANELVPSLVARARVSFPKKVENDFGKRETGSETDELEELESGSEGGCENEGGWRNELGGMIGTRTSCVSVDPFHFHGRRSGHSHYPESVFSEASTECEGGSSRLERYAEEIEGDDRSLAWGSHMKRYERLMLRRFGTSRLLVAYGAVTVMLAKLGQTSEAKELVDGSAQDRQGNPRSCPFVRHGQRIGKLTEA
jgi:hypothetical protein